MAGHSVIRVHRRDLEKHMPFVLPTNARHRIEVIGSRAYVLDAEDEHFNTNRSVLLPDLGAVEGAEPKLDQHRMKGLDVIYAALVHAKAHADQGLVVTGHADRSGDVRYNRKLSLARAENVSLLLRGKREDWRKQAAKSDAVDDYQTVLKWQSKRVGWKCDPGPIDNRLGGATQAAIKAFQIKYNQAVDEADAAGADAPFKTKIAEDGAVGPEVWGAFYDVYMSELMLLLELDKYSDLEARQAKLKAPPSMPDFTACGEHVPYDPALRDPFEEEKDEHLEGPPNRSADRRVELLFFDPGEEVPLPCKAKASDCKPPICPLYVDRPFQLYPIGIPKGLTLMEASLRLVFVDPQGKTRPFPEGLEVQVHFGDPDALEEDDDEEDSTDPFEEDEADDPTDPASDDEDDEAVPQEPTVTTGPDGVLRFAIARRASNLFLRFVSGERPFVTAMPDELNDQKLASADELADAVGTGRVAFQLPSAFTTRDGRWVAAPELKFKDGQFTDITNRQTVIGSRDKPAELKLDIAWQYFRFEFFDRWTKSLATVPQPRSKDADGKVVPPLVLEGHERLLKPAQSPNTSEARTVWDLPSGADTIHCLAWLRRPPDDAGKPRELPDKDCTVRFTVDSGDSLFIRTDGDGKTASARRDFVMLAVDADLINTPSAERLRYYDVPDDWRSIDYPARLMGEDAEKIRPFAQVATTKSALDKPYVFSLDTLVLSSDLGSHPDKLVTWDDADDAKRFSIRDSKLAVWKPHAQDTYFTDLAALKPKPTGPVLCDLPGHVRLLTRGKFIYEAFNARVSAAKEFEGFPVGARLARRFDLIQDRSTTAKMAVPSVDIHGPFFHLTYEDRAPKPNGSAASDMSKPPQAVNETTGHAAVGLIRCAAHDGTIEEFTLFNYVSVYCNFAPSLPTPPGDKKLLIPVPSAATQKTHVRKCLLATADRWEGRDAYSGGPASFEIGSPVVARGGWKAILVPGHPTGITQAMLWIDVFKEGRAGISVTDPRGSWTLEDMEATASGTYAGWFTAAHELGHVMGQPDEYTTTDWEPSLDLPNISEFRRSPGEPYGFDDRAMMNTNRWVRTRSFWHLPLWAQDHKCFPDDAPIAVKQGSRNFSPVITPRRQSRVQWPALLTDAATVNAVAGGAWAGASFGPRGLCDLFVYVTGRDDWTARDLGGAGAEGFDGVVVVRVKMAWRVGASGEYDDLRSHLLRVQSGIESQFNSQAGRRLVFRGTFDGKPARLRVLFAPRFVCRTFPTGDGADKYLDSIGLPPVTKPYNEANYHTCVQANISQWGIHGDIEIVRSGGAFGVSADTPRRATVRRDPHWLLIFSDNHFDEDVLRLFRLLIGLDDKPIAGAASFQVIADQLKPRLVAVPEYAP